MTLKQGDLRLLETDLAQRLLLSRIPARFAYIATDGTPRVLATWFNWTGEVLEMPTFLAAPHVRHAAGRVRALRANPDVAVTIDTETAPPEVLTMRGRVTITEVDGIPPGYAAAAHRYLGDDVAGSYLASIDQPGTRMASINLRPAWVGLLDFQSRMPSALGGVLSQRRRHPRSNVSLRCVARPQHFVPFCRGSCLGKPKSLRMPKGIGSNPTQSSTCGPKPSGSVTVMSGQATCGGCQAGRV